MKIETAYDIGYKFWVPRVVIEVQQEKMDFEGETWYRDVEVFVPSAVQKEIIGIDITIDRLLLDKPHVRDMVVRVGNYDTISQFYYENAIPSESQSEDDCVMIAQEYSDRGQEYYGN